jgi:polysaccharide export outer membrane protein
VFALLLLPVWAAGAPASAKDYTLEPGDVVGVKVFQEPDLDRELRVSQEGDLYFPLIGKVIATGRTLAEVEQTVREAYDRDFLVNPQINIVVLKYQIRTVNVLGAVNQPQAVEYPPEQRLTILDAISRAGGFNRLADRRRVRLTRTLPDGRVENSVINTDELMSGVSRDPLVLKKDDVVFVPERVL